METTISYNPATGEKIGETPLNTVEELNEAVQKAKIAQQKWAQLSFNDRRDIILKAKQIMSIASGKKIQIVRRLMSGADIGTWFSAEK